MTTLRLPHIGKYARDRYVNDLSPEKRAVVEALLAASQEDREKVSAGFGQRLQEGADRFQAETGVPSGSAVRGLQTGAKTLGEFGSFVGQGFKNLGQLPSMAAGAGRRAMGAVGVGGQGPATLKPPGGSKPPGGAGGKMRAAGGAAVGAGMGGSKAQASPGPSKPKTPKP